MKLTKRNKVVVPVVLLLGIVIGGAVVLQTKGISAALLEAGRKVTYGTINPSKPYNQATLDCLADPNADCDNDGLKNWQEKLYHTDPMNPDTDGDGYLDGEEVASGYDPTIPAPNDALPGTDTSKPRTPPKNLTLYLAQILSQKIANGEFSPSSNISADIANDPNAPYNEQTLTDALAQIGQQAKEHFAPPVIKDTDIKISQAPTTKAAVILYISQFNDVLGNAIAEIKKLNVPEPQMLKDTVDTKNTDNIVVYINQCQNVIAGLKDTEVPQDLAQWHKDMIANISAILAIFEAVKNVQADPALATAGLETYMPTIKTFQALTEDLFSKADSFK